MRSIFLLLLLFAWLLPLSAQNWPDPTPKFLSTEQVLTHGITAVQEYESLKKLADSQGEEAAHVFSVIKYPNARTEYNAAGKPTRKFTYDTQTGREVTDLRYRYNNAGLLERMEETTYISIEINNSVRREEFTTLTHYAYDQQGRLVHMFVTYKDEESKQEEKFYTWNAAGQLLQKTSWHLIEGYCDGQMEYMTQSTYHHDGQQVTITQIALDPKTKAPIGDKNDYLQEEVLAFDGVGRLTRQTIHQLPTDSYYAQSYTYQKGHLFKCQYFSKQPTDLFLEEEYFYNKAGLPVMIRSRGENSEMDGLERVFEYFYQDE